MATADVLKTNSDRSQACATTFLRFKDHLPATNETAVTSIVTELFGLSRALLDLRKSIEDPRNDAYLDRVKKERETASRSVTHTLRDIHRHASIVDELRERELDNSERAREAYKVTWSRIAEHFADEGDRIRGCETLTARLDTYIQFLKDVRAKLEGDSTSREFKETRSRLERLLQKQEKNFEDSLGLGRLTLGGADVPSVNKQRTKSWERSRPPENPPGRASRPQPGNRPEDRRRPGRRSNYDSDPDPVDLVDSASDDYEDEAGLGPIVDFDFDADDGFDRPPDVLRPERPGQSNPRPGIYPSGSQSPFSPLRPNPTSMGYFQPAAPEPPYPAAPGFVSPSNSAATPSTLSVETNSSNEDHWLPTVFGLARPATSFRTTGAESGVFGDHDPGVLSHLRDHYSQYLKLPFEDAHVELRVFIKDDDRRAKLLVRQDRGNRKLIACEAAANLRILRHESCLQLCQPAKPDRRDRRAEARGKVYLWTMLRFMTYERMVIFWCAFHALKAQDEYAQLERLKDTTLDGEDCLFNGVIDDDGYKHAFHLLRDRDSRGLRLQASALKGQMKRCPIWTAFITYNVGSRSWARQVEERKIHLQDLMRYVFTDADLYEPPLGVGGEHEIRFVGARDARRFMEVLRGLAVGKR